MILGLFIFGFFFFCGALIYGYRSRAHSAEARANRAEGALDESRKFGNKMRDIAALAIREAAQAAKMDADELLPPLSYDVEIGQGDRVIAKYEVANNYIAAIEAFCLNCNVSVRHDPKAYPVHCPACQTLIDPVLDNPPIMLED